MSKITRYDGTEVVVTIPCDTVYSGGLKHPPGSQASQLRAAEDARSVMSAIKRSLGAYETGCNDPDWRWVSEDVCEHCGAKWTEESNDYNECCEKDGLAEDERARAKEPT